MHSSYTCYMRSPGLQEGAGHAVPSAYVELVFDNSDGRFPVSIFGRLVRGGALRSRLLDGQCRLAVVRKVPFVAGVNPLQALAAGVWCALVARVYVGCHYL